MKKYIFGAYFYFIFLSFLSPILYSRNPAIKKRITYHQARHLDLEQILDMYENISPEDALKIVILPHPKRRMVIKEAIRKGEIFIARDPHFYDRSKRRNRPIIVSLLKIHLVTDYKELLNKLIYEIRSLEPIPPYASKIPRESGCYMIPFDKTLDYRGKRHIDLEDAPIPQAPTTPTAIIAPRVFRARDAFAFNKNQTHIYYGGAFTFPSYRGKGINTKLQVYALNHILDNVIEHIKANQSKRLQLLYGQVESNTMSISSVRVFADYINLINLSLMKEIPQEHTRITYYGYRSFRPVFRFEGSTLIQLPDENPLVQSGEGLGKILSYEIPNFTDDDDNYDDDDSY